MVLDTQIKATIVAGVDEKSFRDGVNYARDTGKKIDKNLVAEIKVNLATLQLKLAEAVKILNKAKKDGNEAMKLTAQMNVNDIRKQITYVNGELNNMARTGDRNISALGNHFDKTNKKIEESTGSVKGLGEAIGALGIGVAFDSLARGVITLAGNLQQARIAFTTMLRSGEQAEVLLKDLADFAKNTPFELTGLREQTRSLLAFGFQANDIIPLLTTLGNISAGVGADKLPRLTYALGQVKAAGFLAGTELRQFTETGIPLIAELAVVTGHSTADIATSTKDMNISYEQVRQALDNLTASGGQFAGLMEAQSLSLQGSFSNLQDSLNILGEQVGMVFVPILTVVTKAITGVTEVVGNRAKENPVLSQGIFIITGLLTSLLAVSIAYSLALPAITAGLLSMGSALAILTGPIGLVIAGVGALYAAWNNNFLGMQETVGIFAERVRFAIEVVKVAFQRINAVVKPVMDSLRQITDRTTKAVVSSFDSLKGIGNRVKQAMDVALTVMTLGLNKLVAFTYRKLSELDFVVGLRAEATNNITRAEVARSQANNPNLLAPKKFDINDLDFSKATRISGSPSISIPDISAGGGAGGSGGGSSAKKEIEEVNTDLIRLEKQLDINANRYKELGKAGKVAFDAIDSAITDSGKTIDDLNSKLGKTQDELNSIEGSIAQRVINIQKELETVGDSLTGEITDKERNALERKQIDLQKELSLATQEVNQETLDELNRQDKLSETEKLLEKRDALTKEQEALKSQIEFEEQLNQNLKDKKVQFLEEFTARYGVQLKKEEDLLKESVETRIGEMRRLQLAGFTQQATQQAQGASGSNTAVTVSFGQVNINNGMDEQQFYQGVETAVTKAVKENNLGYN